MSEFAEVLNATVTVSISVSTPERGTWTNKQLAAVERKTSGETTWKDLATAIESAVASAKFDLVAAFDHTEELLRRNAKTQDISQ